MLNITIKDRQTGLKKEVQISRTINGDYFLREHPEIDIIVMPEKNKILSLPKDDYNDRVYNIQDKLFNFMLKEGTILPDTVTGGNIYGSLQAMYNPTPPGGESALQVAIYTIANFIEDQRPEFTYEKEFHDAKEKQLLEPSIKNSTELGEVPQEPFKGSIPKYGFPTRGIYRYNY